MDLEVLQNLFETKDKEKTESYLRKNFPESYTYEDGRFIISGDKGIYKVAHSKKGYFKNFLELKAYSNLAYRYIPIKNDYNHHIENEYVKDLLYDKMTNVNLFDGVEFIETIDMLKKLKNLNKNISFNKGNIIGYTKILLFKKLNEELPLKDQISPLTSIKVYEAFKTISFLDGNAKLNSSFSLKNLVFSEKKLFIKNFEGIIPSKEVEKCSSCNKGKFRLNYKALLENEVVKYSCTNLGCSSVKGVDNSYEQRAYEDFVKVYDRNDTIHFIKIE